MLLLLRQGLEIEYDILEIEFYLLKEGCHEDPYTHGAEEQRSSGRWYVSLVLFSSSSTTYIIYLGIFIEPLVLAPPPSLPRQQQEDTEEALEKVST